MKQSYSHLLLLLLIFSTLTACVSSIAVIGNCWASFSLRKRADKNASSVNLCTPPSSGDTADTALIANAEGIRCEHGERDELGEFDKLEEFDNLNDLDDFGAASSEANAPASASNPGSLDASIVVALFHQLLEDVLIKYGLSSQERQIAFHVLSMKSNKTIANELYMSQSTIKYHIGKIFTKTHSRCREEFWSAVNTGLHDDHERLA